MHNDLCIFQKQKNKYWERIYIQLEKTNFKCCYYTDDEIKEGKCMRTLFRKAGFQTYLVDEFRTSCRCSKCEIGICKKTMVRENSKPFRTGNVLVHGLICCKNGCGYWNRDVNDYKQEYFNWFRRTSKTKIYMP